jgi:putative ABC transport system permease protein
MVTKRWFSAIRRPFRRRAYSLGVIVTIAIVVAASTCVFVAFYGIFLRQYSFRDFDRLVTLFETDRDTGQRHLPMTDSAYPIYKEQLASMESVAAFIPVSRGFDERRVDTGEPVSLVVASPDLFPLLGITPQIGRLFSKREGLSGGEPVALLSADLWQRSFGSRRDVIGQTLRLKDVGGRDDYTIVGVLPADAAFPYPLYPIRPDVWVSYREHRGRFVPGHHLQVIGKLKVSATVATLQTELEQVARGIGRENPRWYGAASVYAVPLRAESLREVRELVVALGVAFALIASIGAANLLHLMVARRQSQRRDLSIRVALGAPAPALFRFVGFEIGFLALIGSGVGLALAYAGVAALPLVLPPALNIPTPGEALISPAVLAFVAAIVVLGTLALAGGVWALHRNADVRSGLTGPASSPWQRGSLLWRSGTTLLACQVTFAFILTCGALSALQHVSGLLGRWQRQDPQRLLALDVRYSGEHRGDTTLEWQAFLERARSQPAVRAVALADAFPLTTALEPFSAIGDAGPLFEKERPAEFHVVSRSYGEVLGIQPTKGRWFGDGDDTRRPGVCVINEAMARRFFGSRSPIGVRLRSAFVRSQSWPREWEIVGVVPEVQRLDAEQNIPSAVYVPWEQTDLKNVTVVVRTKDQARKVSGAMRREVLSVHPGGLQVGRIQTGTDMLPQSAMQARTVGEQLTVLGLLALAFAAVGIYSIVSFHTSLRVREMAIRLALGSHAGRLFGLVVARTVAQVAIGVAIGVPVAWVFMRTLGYGHSGGDIAYLALADLAPYLLTALLCIGLGVLGAAPAAWRAASTDAAQILSTE